MKVATRITLAAAVVVTLTSTAYAVFDLRARQSERMSQVEREAVTLATSLRIGFETAPPDFARKSAPQLGRELSRSAGGQWKWAV